jgi:hypothetical protein
LLNLHIEGGLFMSKYIFKFKGGVIQNQQNTVKFLLFLINGGKEFSFYDAKNQKIVSAEYDEYDDMSNATFRRRELPGYSTECGIVKVFLFEKPRIGRNIQQSFYLALSNEKNSNEITIKPLSTQALAMSYGFTAHAKLLKPREALSILDENSISDKFLLRQEQLPIETLRKIASIKRFEAPKEKSLAVHGGVRFLRI